MALAANLAGGTHHAFADHGEGYCVLNDVAVAIRVLPRRGASGRRWSWTSTCTRATARPRSSRTIRVSSRSRCTASATTRRGRCARRLDVGLADGIGDEDYLALLTRHLADVLQQFTPDIVFYLAGVDPAFGDRYGRLALSDEGIRRRDRHVLESCAGRGLPTVITLAGGYAATPERTAELHAIVFREAVAIAQRRVAGHH